MAPMPSSQPIGFFFRKCGIRVLPREISGSRGAGLGMPKLR
jgi:hypothetical protein